MQMQTPPTPPHKIYAWIRHWAVPRRKEGEGVGVGQPGRRTFARPSGTGSHSAAMPSRATPPRHATPCTVTQTPPFLHLHSGCFARAGKRTSFGRDDSYNSRGAAVLADIRLQQAHGLLKTRQDAVCAKRKRKYCAPLLLFLFPAVRMKGNRRDRVSSGNCPRALSFGVY